MRGSAWCVAERGGGFRAVGFGEVVEGDVAVCEEGAELGGGVLGVVVGFLFGGGDLVLVESVVGAGSVGIEQVVDSFGVEGAQGEGEAAHPVAQGF